LHALVRLDRILVNLMPTHVNPAISTDFPDPSILLAPDGLYYAYGTQNLEGDTPINVQTARSANLVTWELLPDAMPTKPKWASATQDFWAPQVLEDHGTFYLYFSALANSGQGFGLGLAIGSAPEGPFKPVAEPILVGDSFKVIDPMAFDDPISGRHFLYWGSAEAPIYGQELDDSRHYFAPDSTAREVLLPSADRRYERLIEGAFVIHRDGFYYLFYSGDNCWENDAYAVMVARSTDPLGPYQRRAEALGAEHSAIVENSAWWHAPGQNCVFRDADGNDWMAYHAVDPFDSGRETKSGIRRPMLLDPLIYIDGWPELLHRVPSRWDIDGPTLHKSHKSAKSSL
jgi:arabinan endo-1,5-alpha-L-arabinosidase